MNKIILENIKVATRVGCCQVERDYPQILNITLILDVDFSKAIQTDELEDAVDYYSLSEAVIAFVEKSEFKLMETLGDEIIKICKGYNGVQKVEVQLHKRPAVMPKVENVIVRMVK